jgi:hypothetical protein
MALAMLAQRRASTRGRQGQWTMENRKQKINAETWRGRVRGKEKAGPSAQGLGMTWLSYGRSCSAVALAGTLRRDVGLPFEAQG